MNAIAPSSAPATGPALDNRRALAGLIDLGVVVVGTVLLSTVVGIITGGDVAWGPQMALVSLAWALYYYFALESGDGQTLGKKLMKLRVVRADGGSTGMQEIAVRTLLRIVDGVALYLVGLVVMLVTGNRRQRLGDIAAGTIVVDASSAPAPAAPAAAVAAAAPAVVSPPESVLDGDANERPADAPPTGEPSFPVAKSPVDVGSPLPGMTAPERPDAPAVQTFTPFNDPAPADEPDVEVAPQPPAEEPANDPTVEPVSEQPSVEPVSEEPSVEFVSAEPSVEPVAEQPSFGHGVDEPVEEPSVEPVAEEPSVEPVAEEPSVEPVAEEPSVEPSYPEPAAQDPVQPAAHEPQVEIVSTDQDEAGDAEDDQMTVKSVETVSAMDLIMGDDGDDEDSPPPSQDDSPAGA